ncbi:MAG: hypothetical protein R2751_02290 [Bacteroidales bacterium]
MAEKRPVCFVSARKGALKDHWLTLGMRGRQMHVSNLSFLNPFKIWRTARYFRREQVGVLITNLSGDMKLAGLSARLAGVPTILYRRGSAVPVRNTVLNRFLYRQVLSQVVANSQKPSVPSWPTIPTWSRNENSGHLQRIACGPIRPSLGCPLPERDGGAGAGQCRSVVA